MPQNISPSESDYAAFIAIDWADREHAWAMQVAGSNQRETGKLKHTPEAIDAWATQLAKRFAGRPVAIALEQSRGALVYALSNFQHIVLYPIHPTKSYNYRKAVFPSGSKDDPKDADVLLDLLMLHRNQLRVLQPDTEESRKLRILVEQRRQMVDQRTALTNRITNQLKLYFPQVLDWFDELSAPIVAAFLQRWPTLAELQKEDSEVVRQFFYQAGSRSAQRIESRLRDIQKAKALVDDAAIIEGGVLVVRTLLAAVAVFSEGIRALEAGIAAVASHHPDYAIFASFPGAGPALAARLLAAFGSRRERYSSVDELLSFSGIAPVTEASGKQRWVHFRWKCPKFLRQTFHEFAALSLQRCDWARAFYDMQRAKGKAHHAAVRSLAFKWIRILFRCWKSGKTYDDSLYAAARTRRGTSVPTPSMAANRQPNRGKRQDGMLKSTGEIIKSLMAEA